MREELKAPSLAERQTINLDGTWEVGETSAGDRPPVAFEFKAPVPGLLSSARPAIPGVGEFASRERQYNSVMAPIISGGAVEMAIDEEAKNSTKGGVSRQGRDYFWYRRRFTAPAARRHAFLTVLKAQFGSEVWVNGAKVGARDSCFTSGTYDVSSAIHWGMENEVLIRVGAHPGVLPEGNACNVDFEKEYWHPGIWDSVELHCFDGPGIRRVQVAPRLDPREILVETIVENLDAVPAEITLSHTVCSRDGKEVIANCSETVRLAPSECVTHRCTIAVPQAKLWSPDSPNLYIVESSTGGDSVQTRFGMREFRFDTFSKRAYLNGEPIFLRGNCIALHRFFEDPLCGGLPWNDEWVRKLLTDGPRKMHWNFLKLSIGPAPRRWFEIADEIGLLVLYEFPIWTLSPQIFFGYEKSFDRPVLKQEMTDWVRDNCNHPSIIYWNTSLESYLPWLSKEILPEVRKADLSNRAWGEGWNAPTGPDDPIEDHPYEFSGNGMVGAQKFDIVSLEGRGGFERPHLGATPSGHASVIGEYGWLWLTRQGDPTLLTVGVYRNLPFPVSTPAERIETASYLLAGLTEYWRSYRHYAGVAYYGYLASSRPNGYTSDYWADVEELEFHPKYQEYVSEAFKPMGVYLNFWRRELQAGTDQDFIVMLCNDDPAVKTGKLNLTLEGADETFELGEEDFYLGRLGQQSLRLHVSLPEQTGAFTLKATATAADGSTTVSRRWLTLQAEPIEQHRRLPEVQTGQQFGGDIGN